jgi:hypothetical protein
VLFQVQDENGVELLQDAEGSTLRKIVFYLYFGFVWIFAITLVVLIIVNGGGDD